MSLRDAMRKAAGLLVEIPGEDSAAQESSQADLDALLASTAAPKTVEQIVREAEGPNLDEIQMPGHDAGPSAELPPIPGGVAAEPTGDVTPAAIYQMASLPPAPFSAEQMLEMLASLPQELPLDTKRQTVKVTLGALGKTMGATPETVVADASRKMAALTAYIENLSKRTADTAAAAEQEIAALQAQIEEKRKAMQAARHQLATVTQLCEAESDKLDDVLEFFSLDVAPSKYAPAEEPAQ
jgi:hypothetical protein